MNKLYIRVLYGVDQMVFNVGENGEVKKHFSPLCSVPYAFASSSNVKHNLKNVFCDLSGLETPKTEFSKNITVSGKTISKAKDSDNKEQGGVSTFIDIANVINAIFGAWASELQDSAKYSKAALKANINVSDMMPISPFLQKLGNSDAGVFCGDKNSSVVLVTGGKNSKKIFKTPEELVDFSNCSIEDAKEAFASFRPMNMYRDKQTASGIYYQDFSIELETFAKVKLSSIDGVLNWDYINELVEKRGYRVLDINGEKYLSPSKDDAIKLFGCLIDAITMWDFSSNNSLHGSIKETLRYSFSLNAQKLNQCTTASLYFDNDESKKKAKLSLRNSKEVYSFNTTNLERWHICDGSNGDDKVPTNIDADYEFKEAAKAIGESFII